MAGFGVLGVFFGALAAWCGFNGLSLGTVIASALKDGKLPAYKKGSGLADLAGPVIGYELLKSTLSGGGLSKLGSLLPLGGGKGADEEPPDTGDAGGDGGDVGGEDPITDPIPIDF